MTDFLRPPLFSQPAKEALAERPVGNFVTGSDNEEKADADRHCKMVQYIQGLRVYCA